MRKIWIFISLVLLILLVACGTGEPEATPAQSDAEVAVSIQETTESLSTPTLAPPIGGSEQATAVTPNETQPEGKPTVAPEATVALEPTPTLLPPTAVPVIINGMPSNQFVIMDDAVKANVAAIYAQGQEMGRDPNTFAILGDSLIATPQSIAHWDGDTFVLSPEFEHLQPTIDYYAGSFNDYDVSVRVGLHSWSVFDPLWSDKDFCEANEDLLACKIRIANPSVMFILLGSNDAGSPGGFDFNMRQVVQTVIDAGIVPILATKADRFEGGDNINNNIIRDIAVEMQVPLMEFDLLAETIPARGLSGDNVHLTYSEPYDYNNPDTFTFGYPVHNLAVLVTLDAVKNELGRMN